MAAMWVSGGRHPPLFLVRLQLRLNTPGGGGLILPMSVVEHLNPQAPALLQNADLQPTGHAGAVRIHRTGEAEQSSFYGTEILRISGTP